MNDKSIENLVQSFRDERCKELFNKLESELLVGEHQMLNQYIEDYNKPRIWKPLKYIDVIVPKYEISNFGEIRNVSTGSILKPRLTEFGYQRLSIPLAGKVYTLKVHRLVAMAFLPNPKNKREVNHISCVKTCNWVGNLEWATSAENKKHAREHGLYHDPKGQEKFNVRYTDNQINQVCKLLEDGKSPIQISRIMNIPVSCPMSIKYNGRWHHISCNYKIPKAHDLPRFNKDMKQPGAKYTEDQIKEVCKLLSEGVPQSEIERRTNVTSGVVCSIYNRKTWKYISKDYTFPAREDLISDLAKNHNAIAKLVETGENDYGKILEQVGLPDTRNARKYVARQKYRLIHRNERKQRSTTIDQLTSVEKHPQVSQ